MDQTYLPEINEALCTGCGECLAACTPHALAVVDGKAVLARPDLCEYEGGCEPACPEGAIVLRYLVVFDPADVVSAANPAKGTKRLGAGFRDRSTSA